MKIAGIDIRENHSRIKNKIGFVSDENMFFDALGIELDFDKIRYYILLDELLLELLLDVSVTIL